MAQRPDIDSVLVQWGDRLFQPGNGIVGTRPLPRLDSRAVQGRAASIRRRIRQVEDWRFGGTRIDDVDDRREAFNVMLSMPRGIDPLIVPRAARESAQAELADLERQFRLAAFEKTVLSPPKVTPAVAQNHGPAAVGVPKDACSVEFLELPAAHGEADLHQVLLSQLRTFFIELGRDFCFVGSEFPLQVGSAARPPRRRRHRARYRLHAAGA